MTGPEFKLIHRSWGSTSSRTSVYKVPLIAASSLILALAIVAGIIM